MAVRPAKRLLKWSSQAASRPNLGWLEHPNGCFGSPLTHIWHKRRDEDGSPSQFSGNHRRSRALISIRVREAAFLYRAKRPGPRAARASARCRLGRSHHARRCAIAAGLRDKPCKEKKARNTRTALKNAMRCPLPTAKCGFRSRMGSQLVECSYGESCCTRSAPSTRQPLALISAWASPSSRSSLRGDTLL